MLFKYIVVVRLFIYAYRPVYIQIESVDREFLVFFATFFRKLSLYLFGLKVYYFLWRSTEYRIIPTSPRLSHLSILLWARRIQHLLLSCYNNTRTYPKEYLSSFTGTDTTSLSTSLTVKPSLTISFRLYGYPSINSSIKFIQIRVLYSPRHFQ